MIQSYLRIKRESYSDDYTKESVMEDGNQSNQDHTGNQEKQSIDERPVKIFYKMHQ
jgi:hypothetical protein